MDTVNNKYAIEAEVLSPLHVGAGKEKDWCKGVDYVEEGDMIYILDQKKVLNHISVDLLSGFLINRDENGLKSKLAGHLKEVSEQVFRKPADSSNDIKTFVKNGLTNKPVLPGSSLKGSIRSVLLDHFIDPSNKPNRKNKDFEKEIFGSPDKGDELLRFIKISDGGFTKTELINTKIFNLSGRSPDNLKGSWKPPRFNTLYEVLPVGEKGILTISIAEKAFENAGKFASFNFSDRKKEIIHNSITDKLFPVINAHTRAYIRKEIAFFEKYRLPETDKIHNQLRDILEQIPGDNSACVLKMSAGSGFHSITGDWQFDDYSIDRIDLSNRNRGMFKGEISAKSRKMAVGVDYYGLMGFVKLSILTPEMVARREMERQKKLQDELKKKEAELLARQKEQERIEAEKQAKIEAEKQAELKRLEEEARQQKEREALLAKIEKEQLEAQERNERIREEHKKEILSKGLDELAEISDFDMGVKIIKEYRKALGNQSLENDSLTTVKLFIQRCIEVNDRRWKKFPKKNWSPVRYWVGDQLAKKWYDELVKES